MSNTRADRLGDHIKKIVAQIIETKIKDPRIGFVTVTDVHLSADLEHATLYYTVFGTDKEKKSTARALRSATGMVRSEVSRVLNVRQTPTIRFIADDIADNARSLEQTLKTARERDAEIAIEAKQAKYAGDTDPYKHPVSDGDDD